MDHLIEFLNTRLSFTKIEAKSMCQRDTDEVRILNKAWQLKKNILPPWVKEDVDRMIMLVPWRAWFVLYKLTPCVNDLTLFELQLITRYPLYLYHAMHVPIKTCIEFAKKFNISVTPPSVAFAYAIQLIEEHPMCSVPVEEMNQKLRQQGLTLDVNFEPFGRDVLKGHELENVDLTEQSYGETPVKRAWQRLQKIREKKTCQLRIIKTAKNEFTLQQFTEELAFELLKLLQ
jgi:hypothetical protein